MLKQPAKYNPAFLSEEKLIETFVARHADLSLILGILKENIGQPSNQHVLIIGQRGIGKTTLALRVAAEVQRDEELKCAWYPLIFAEESYQVATPGEFWLEAIFHLGEKTGNEQWRRTYKELKGEADENRLREKALAQLMDFADSIGKRLLLIVENFDMLLADQLGNDDAWALRHTFLNEPRIMMLATAIRRIDEISGIDKAMYELFKLYELKPLTNNECRAVWTSITGREISEKRIKPIQILTGGNPRLLTIISTFGANKSFKELMGDIMQLVDDHTEYFKSHLDNLAQVERKVYLALAELWDPSPARDVAAAARLDVNKTSSLLNRLVERSAVVVMDGGKRTKWYQISERMYNIYYLMRRRGAPSSRVQAVVNFMVSFYDDEELLSITKCIAEEACQLPLEQKEYNYFAYKSIVERMAKKKLADKFIKETPPEFFNISNMPESFEKEFLSKISSTLLRGKSKREAKNKIKNKLQSLLNEIERLINQPERIIEVLELYKEAIEIAPNDPLVWAGFGDYLVNSEKYDEAEQAFRKAIEIDPEYTGAWVALGALFHQELGRYDEAEEAYRKAIETDPEYAWAWVALGALLHQELERYDEAEEAYRKAIEIDHEYAWAWLLLGNLLHEIMKKYDEAEEAYRKAIELNPEFSSAWMSLGQLLYEKLNKPDKAETAFKKALGFKPFMYDVIYRLVHIYMHNKQPGKIIDLFKENAEEINKSSSALNALAFAYYQSAQKAHLKDAEEWVRKAVNMSPKNACFQHTLASILTAQGKCDDAFEPAFKYLQKAEVVGKSLEDATDLMVNLAARGYAEKALDLLVKSPSANLLEPLIIGIRLYLGENVMVANEILEVGKDVMRRIKEREEQLSSENSPSATAVKTIKKPKK